MSKIKIIILIIYSSTWGEMHFLDTLHYQETLNPRIGISKEKCYGVFIGNYKKKVDIKSISVHIPSGRINKMTLRAISVDGTYAAKIEYRIPDTFSDSVYYLRYPQTNRGYLSKYSLSELAICVSVAAIENNFYDSLLVVRWGTAPESGINILYDAGDDEMVYVNCLKTGDISCDPLRGNKKILRFNRRCYVTCPTQDPFKIEFTVEENARKTDSFSIVVFPQ